VLISDQPISFVGIDPLTVSQPNAVPSTVLIRDAVSGRTYTEGLDYTVSQTPAGLQIDRVLGGNIAAGQPLLLTYDYDTPDANQIATTSYGADTRYEFTKGPLAGFAPYGRFYGQDQDVSGGTAVPTTVRDYALGVDYQYEGLTLRAEREWYNSNVFPYDAWRYEARLNQAISSYTTASANATYTDTQYHDPDQSAKSFSLSGSLSQRLTTELTMSVYAAYVHVLSDPGGRTQGLEEGLEVDWYHRDTNVYMLLRNSTLNSDVAEQQFQFFQIGLKRTF
jgi:hypothetical protein